MVARNKPEAGQRTAAPAKSRDALTGLYDASQARDTLAQWQNAALRAQATAPIHAMLLELGRFDTVNLAYGSDAGDRALVEVGRRILFFASDEFENGNWLVARMGGGQFLIAANEKCSRERWQWLAEALGDAVAHPVTAMGSNDSLRLSPRVALMRPAPGEGPDMLLERLAETARRARERQGGRLLWVDGEITLSGRRGALLEADLLSALDRGEIAVLFQPQYRIDSGDTDIIIGAEALARWQHPTMGRIGAGALFAVAERADYIAQLSRQIAQTALSQAAQWNHAAHPDLRLSLNITPADLASGDFAREFGALLAESGFPADRLTLEITEQVLLSDLDRTATVLAQLKKLGVRIALDDFGAGFCNFRYLKLLPLDYLKLDRAMVDGIATDSRDLAVLRGIVAMARALELTIVVEGIETQSQRALVAGEGCVLYQGFLKAAPMDAQEFAKLIA